MSAIFVSDVRQQQIEVKNYGTYNQRLHAESNFFMALAVHDHEQQEGFWQEVQGIAIAKFFCADAVIAEHDQSND